MILAHNAIVNVWYAVTNIQQDPTSNIFVHRSQVAEDERAPTLIITCVVIFCIFLSFVFLSFCILYFLSFVFLCIDHRLPRRRGPPTLIITSAHHRIQQNPGNWGQTLGPDILFKRYLTWGGEGGEGERVKKLLRQMLCLKPWWTWDAIGHSSS